MRTLPFTFWINWQKKLNTWEPKLNTLETKMAKISHTKIKQPSFGGKRPKLTYTKISRFTVTESRFDWSRKMGMQWIGSGQICLAPGHPRPFLIHCCCSSWTTVSNLLHTRHTTFSNFYTLMCMSQWRVSYLTPSHTTSPRVVICSWEIMPIYISRRSHGLIRKRGNIKYIMFLLI
jgi:hypothetical protein